MTDTRTTHGWAFFLLLGCSLLLFNGNAASQTLQQRLQAIYAISAEEMAAASGVS
jgi:hypothetical protein